MNKYCIIGHPIGHSLSPQIHARLFELSGAQGEYTLQHITPEELDSKKDFLAGFKGYNITIPHKIAIIKHCTELDESAKRYNSVNCMHNTGDKKIGYNTDCVGFVKSIAMMGCTLNSKVLVIGCGGVGRMIAIEAALSGAELTIAVLKKDVPLAEKVIEEIHAKKADAVVTIVSTGSDILNASQLGEKTFDLLINATPVGMHPNVDKMPCTADVVDKVSAVFDVIYNPKETLVVKTAREKGKKGLCGMAMLVLQAVAAHEIWYGASFNDDDIRQLITDMENMI